MQKLRAYQQQVVNELKYLPSSALFMGTGTGKTLTSLELFRTFETDNILVVCPQNAINQWKETILRQFPQYTIINWAKSYSSKQINKFLVETELPNNSAIVINYDMIHRVPYMKHLINETWTIVSDEMHRIKNYGTRKSPVKATHFMLDLAEKTKHKIGLTATPTQGLYGGYIDYYTQLRFLGYLDMRYNEFYDRFVLYQERSVAGIPFPIKVITGYKNKDYLEHILKTMARRYTPKYGDFEPQFNKIMFDKPKSYNKMVKDRVYKDIPLNNVSRARIAKKTLTTGVVSGKNMLGEPLRYLDNTEKIDWIKDFIEDSDGRVIILYNYNVELDSLIEMAKSMKIKYVEVNGRTKEKSEEIKKEWKVMFGQYQAVSTALDGLQYLSNQLVFFSMPESSLHYIQSLGRIDRIGQEKVPMYYFLLMDGTTDTLIMDLIEQKVEFSEKILEELEIDDVYS